MKLLDRTNKYYLLFFVFLFPVMMAIDYYIIKYLVNGEVNEVLKHEVERIRFYLEEEGELPSSSYLFDIRSVHEDSPHLTRFSDTLIYEAYTQKIIPCRKYEFTTLVGSDKFKISLKHVLLETNELITWLFGATILIFLIMITGLFFITRKISKWAWNPFYKNLTKLKNYDITQKSSVHLETSGIDEFDELNEVITALMNQVEKNFRNLKEFNENISHEMQTPLTVIRNKIVLLLESQNLQEKEIHWVESAYQEANKLSKIGKSLALISKIENLEFSQLENIDIRDVIVNILHAMEDMITFKKLKLNTEFSAVNINLDPILANVLFTNLIKNAIQHNKEGGYMHLYLDQQKFEIENSGDVLTTDPNQLFERFKKNDYTSKSLGIGLAINRKICELYKFKLDYQHEEGKHTFSLIFNPELLLKH